MKKVLFTIALFFAFVLISNAQIDGFFNFSNELSYRDDIENQDSPLFPSGHGYTENVTLPIGSGLLILTALGVGYTIRKKRS